MNFLFFSAVLSILIVSINTECFDEAQDCSKYKIFCRFTVYNSLCRKTCGVCAECGQKEIRGTRVIGGKKAVRGSWPWQILLDYNGYSSCGGAIIAPRWIVTAAHCVFGRERYPYRYIVTVGEYDRYKKEGSEVYHLVYKIHRYPGYQRYRLNNDIALLELESPIRFNQYVKPICLPSQDPPPGTKCYITGWGKMHHPGDMVRYLQQGVLPIVSKKQCNDLNHKNLHIRVTDAMICGGDGGKTKRSGCHGDSGGPLACNVNSTWELHGAVSHGSRTCTSSIAYTVFARVNYFKDWIAMVMSKS